MSLIQEYRNLEDSIRDLKQRLDSLKGNQELQKELEFEQKLRQLMGEYHKSLRDIVSLLDPQYSPNASARGSKASGEKAQRSPRKIKQYRNPHNNEVIETKGGNHRTLKGWKEQFGSEEVESWAKLLD